jgi:hypothetical protein
MLTAAIKQQKHEFCQDLLQFAWQYLATSDCLWFSDEAHFHLKGVMTKQNMRFCASEKPDRVVKMSLHPAKCTMWCAISKQRLTGTCSPII